LSRYNILVDMAEGVNGWIELTRTLAGAYGEWFLKSLAYPSSLAVGIYSWNAKEEDTRSRIYIFLLFSALIGGAVGSIIPDRPPIQERAVVAVTVLILWVFVSLFTHMLCRMMRGKGSPGSTIVAMLQVLALVYVASNFLALLIVSAESTYPAFRKLLAAQGINTPGDVILGIQFLMLLAYVPLTLKSLHGFRGIQGIIISLTAASGAILMSSLIWARGGC
jgi:hypothetical protein